MTLGTVPVTEAQFQRQIEELASRLGWQWVHFERMGNDQGRWRTPARGPLGRGFPDLFLVKGSRALFVECKAQRGVLTDAQRQVRLTLEQLHPYYVWRPSDWAQIMEVLANA